METPFPLLSLTTLISILKFVIHLTTSFPSLINQWINRHSQLNFHQFFGINLPSHIPFILMQIFNQCLLENNQLNNVNFWVMEIRVIRGIFNPLILLREECHFLLWIIFINTLFQFKRYNFYTILLYLHLNFIL